MAEKMDGGTDLLIPCSGCYLNLRKVEDHVKREEDLFDKINEALKEEELEYKGGIKVRHLLDVLSRDFDPENIKPLVKKDLSGLKVAPYYGCQALRPYPDFDDPQEPRTMEPVIEALGAEVHPWDLGSKCCGAALMNTKKDVALELTGAILRAAKGADCVATVCPMCQLNLEAYQKAISQEQGEDLSISILYLPQLMGVAFGLPEKDLKLNLNLALTKSLKGKLGI
jgi:heterodisulfide reductase subunit B